VNQGNIVCPGTNQTPIGCPAVLDFIERTRSHLGIPWPGLSQHAFAAGITGVPQQRPLRCTVEVYDIFGYVKQLTLIRQVVIHLFEALLN
jgi:hypothetical protein